MSAVDVHPAVGDTGLPADLVDLETASAQVRGLWQALQDVLTVDLSEYPVAAVAAADLEVMAVAKHVFDAATARLISHAEALDATDVSVRTVLGRQQWESTSAQRIVTSARLADRHPALADLWAAGRVSVEKVHTVAVGARRLPTGKRAGVVDELTPLLPQLSRVRIHRFLERLADSHHDDPDADAVREQRDWEHRFLAFTHANGLTHITGCVPTLEGHTLQAALVAVAAQQRSAGDQKTNGQRLADALLHLVAKAHATAVAPASSHGSATAATVTIPIGEVDRLARHATRTPLPVPAGVTTGDLVGLLNQHHASRATIGTDLTLGDAAAAFTLCTGTLTGAITDPITQHPFTTQVEAVLAGSTVQPLALGRSQRLASNTQRKALQLRDRTCIIPGCDIPGAECDTHHVKDWATGGRTDTSAMVLLCWAHHREVDLHRWTITRQDTGPGFTVTRTPRSNWRPRM